MAYGDDPNEVKSIIQEKIHKTNSTNGSLNNILGPLKKLKTELDRSEPPNLLRDVRSVENHEIDVS